MNMKVRRRKQNKKKNFGRNFFLERDEAFLWTDEN